MDPGFPSAFWEEVTTALKMERGFSMAFHLQTGGIDQAHGQDHASDATTLHSADER
jgi:hypothetical protein